MPVRKLGPRKYRWGTSGRIYSTRAQAEQQGRAIMAAGYKKKKKKTGGKKRRY